MGRDRATAVEVFFSKSLDKAIYRLETGKSQNLRN
jgi:hypothetical protein